MVENRNGEDIDIEDFETDVLDEEEKLLVYKIL